MAGLTECRLPSINWQWPPPRPEAPPQPEKSSASAGRSAATAPASVSTSPSRAGAQATSKRNTCAVSKQRNFIAGVNDIPLDLGIRHVAPLVRMGDGDGPCTSFGGVQTSCNGLMPEKKASLGWLDPYLNVAAEDFNQQLQKGLDTMCEHLSKMSRATPLTIVEIGSRDGDVAVTLARRFPDLWFQPTEGSSGNIAHGLFVLLDERVAQFGRDLPGGPNSSRLLGPRWLDGLSSESWTADLGRGNEVGLVFAINALQYISQAAVKMILSGARRLLRRGGMVVFCGPFLEGGETSERNLLYDSSLRAFACRLCEQNRSVKLEWGLHDTKDIQAISEAIGFEFVGIRRLGIADVDDWLALEMRKPLPRGRRPISSLNVARRPATVPAMRPLPSPRGSHQRCPPSARKK
eukprot:TRINITY_DN58211_c0_g1_i1.p1 TRINITY_DN58211_c0_g1~~TRINITY_DN58211_c0_g1_i1.p1  ORF type:complete len:406 (-),score=50.68 TRINITY_DN58211_c0_g1_i1:54-1271(-)